MIRLAVIVIGIAVLLIYFAFVRQAFLRCPQCQKVGSWRFDDIGPARETLNTDGKLVSFEQPQRCRRCKGEVVHRWARSEGRSIIKAGAKK